tara:strand:- start:381 stop:671 length:291 start_codon:yes stop_codon:yes gene_type:complete
MKKILLIVIAVFVSGMTFANNGSKEDLRTTNENFTEESIFLKVDLDNQSDIDKLKELSLLCPVYYYAYRDGRYIGTFTLEAPDDYEFCYGVVFLME